MSNVGGQWFTCQELAELDLEALPGHRVNMLRMAEREGWLSRPREGRGGGREYLFSSLPEAARIELALRFMNSHPGDAGLSRQGSSSIPATASPDTIGIPQAAGGVGLAHGNGVVPPGAGRSPAEDSNPRTLHAQGAAPRGRAATRAAARLVIVNMLKAFKEEGALSMTAARSAFTSLFNAGEIPVEEWVAAEVGRLSVKSLERWHGQAARHGAKRLGGNYGNRKGQGQIDRDAALRDFCIANMAARPHLTASQLGEAIHARMGKAIPKRTVQRFMAKAREDYADAFLQAANPDKHKNLRLVAFGSRSEAARYPNEMWEVDASPADVMTIDGRMNLVGIVDVYTRRAKILVTPTPKATAATLLIRRCILDWGVPERIKMDNGKDFASRHVSHALGSLLIEQSFCPPFTPENKPHIERFFGTLQRDFVSLLPGFIGHDVADRKAIEARRSFSQRFGDPQGAIAVELTSDELQERVSDWIETVYHTRRHGSLGTSPKLMTVGYMGSVRAIEDERALDVLLAEAPDTEGQRVVTKKGLRVENALFIAPELGAHVGDRVNVRLDPSDMGRIVVYSIEGEFICVAVCPERTGLSRQEIAVQAKALQKAHQAEQRKNLRKIQREHRPQNIADEIVAAHRNDQVIEFPRKTESYSTPALDEARRAASALDDPMPAIPERHDTEELAAQARKALVIDMPAKPQHEARFTDDWEFVKWALRNEDQLNEGQREYLAEVVKSPAIRIRLDAEKGTSAS